MKVIKDQFALWLIVLLVGAAAFAIPMAAGVDPDTIAVVKQRQIHPERQAANANEGPTAIHDKDSKPAVVGRGVTWRQDYYDRRRKYWEDRVDRRLERRDEYLNEQTGDDDDNADSKGKKGSKADDEDAADSDLDGEEELIERRREYWRDRLDREW